MYNNIYSFLHKPMYKTKKMIKIVSSLVAFGSMFAVSLWAKLSFSPSEGTFIYNCPFTVDVMVDMEGKDTTAMDLKLLLDPSRFSVMNFDGQGWLFRTFTKPKYVTVKRGDYVGIDMVYVFLSTFAPPAWVKWAWKVWTLTIMPHKWVWEMPLGFYFVPGDKWEDSNIPVLSWSELVDGINGVSSAYYTLKEGPCDYHGAADYQVTKWGEFEIVKNEQVITQGVIATITESNLIQKYGRYILLVIVLIALIVVWKKRKHHQQK